MSGPAWIAADWGTSHLRLWLFNQAGQVMARRSSDRGMGTLAPADFEPVLLELVATDLGSNTVPVIICGMAGSRQGWAEAPYAAAPCGPPSIDDATPVATSDERLRVFILPGVKQAKPADVMRGEETQLAGFLSLNPQFDGVVCLPGTHCKWVRISAGEIVSFQTFMTGELFSLLASHSVLQHSVGATGWDDAAFDAAVDDAMSRPAAAAAQLFALRAETLLNSLSPATARARLSGILIGIELAAARAYWLGQNVAIIGAPTLTGAYADALKARGVPVIETDAEQMTLKGLSTAYAALKETQA